MRLGQFDEARTALDRAHEADRRGTPKPGSLGFSLYWLDQVIGDCLMREAELALLDHDFPVDPFVSTDTRK